MTGETGKPPHDRAARPPHGYASAKIGAVNETKEDSMNRLVFSVSAACVASLSCLAVSSPVFAQSDATVQSDVIQHPATNFSSTSAAISDNFQYMNHPPPPVKAASSPSSNGGRGHRHRQTSTDSDSNGGAAAQP